MFIPHGLSLLWRNTTDIQIGFGHDRTLKVRDLYPREVPLLNQLSQPCTQTDIDQWAASHGVDKSRARSIVSTVSDSPVSVETAQSGYMAGVEFHYGARTGRLHVQQRASSGVSLVGAGLVGSLLATILDAEGIGSITVTDSSPVTPAQSDIFGTQYIGQRLDSVIASRLRPRRQRAETTLVISVTTRIPPRDVARTCLADGTPYLPVVIGETGIQCGPLVDTGSPCVECQVLHEADSDPAYPFLAEQVARLPQLEPPIGSAFMTASWLALIILDFVETGRNVLPHHRLHITGYSWPYVMDVQPHPECGCLSARVDDGDDG